MMTEPIYLDELTSLVERVAFYRDKGGQNALAERELVQAITQHWPQIRTILDDYLRGYDDTADWRCPTCFTSLTSSDDDFECDECGWGGDWKVARWAAEQYRAHRLVYQSRQEYEERRRKAGDEAERNSLTLLKQKRRQDLADLRCEQAQLQKQLSSEIERIEGHERRRPEIPQSHYWLNEQAISEGREGIAKLQARSSEIDHRLIELEGTGPK